MFSFFLTILLSAGTHPSVFLNTGKHTQTFIFKPSAQTRFL